MAKKRKTKAEQRSPEDRAVDDVLKTINGEITNFETNWVDLVKDVRGKIDLIFQLIDAAENLRKVKKAVRDRFGKKVFEERRLDVRFRDFACRIKKVRESVPPLIISSKSRKFVG